MNIIYYILRYTKIGKELNEVLWIASRASRKLEQGYREGYVTPKSEFDELITKRDKIEKFK